MLSTKNKGLSTELQCIAACCELGYRVSIPYGDDCRYDFILDIGSKLLRVQVKTARPDKGKNSFAFSTRSTKLKSGKYTAAHYTKNEIDFYATYYDGKCYLVSINDCPNINLKTLRLNPPKNGAKKNISLATDYEIDKVIKNMIPS